jgi:pimeloyl-ACP methyl ester carboxylesterase
MPKASVGRIEIEYETDGDRGAPAFLLFMGAGEQLVLWPNTLIQDLNKAGFQTIRFDYRDCGLSAKFDAAGPVDLGALVAALQSGTPEATPYQLSDMARDAIGVLDHLGIDKAHFAGLSLGGMVAQAAAIDNPGRVLSLTSIASTTGDRHLPPPNPDVVMQMFAVAPHAGADLWIEARARAMTAMQGSKFRASPEEITAAAEQSVRRSLSPAGVTRQLAASIVANPRGKALKGLQAPVLVMHGTEDQVISPLCGEYTAKCAPDSVYVPIEGMGHGFSDELMSVWSEHMIAVARKAVAP